MKESVLLPLAIHLATELQEILILPKHSLQCILVIS